MKGVHVKLNEEAAEVAFSKKKKKKEIEEKNTKEKEEEKKKNEKNEEEKRKEEKNLLTHRLAAWLTNITPCSTILSDKPTGPHLVKKFPAFCGTRKFIHKIQSLFTSKSVLKFNVRTK
jgi:cation transport ATPase